MKHHENYVFHKLVKDEALSRCCISKEVKCASEQAFLAFLTKACLPSSDKKKKKIQPSKFTDFIQTFYSSWSNDLFHQSLGRKWKEKEKKDPIYIIQRIQIE